VALAKMSQSEIRWILSQIQIFHLAADNLAKSIESSFKDQGIPPLSHKVIRSLSLPQDLLILSIITFPHWLSTRYPGGEVTPMCYSKDLGIIREFSNVVLQLKEELDTLEWARQKS